MTHNLLQIHVRLDASVLAKMEKEKPRLLTQAGRAGQGRAGQGQATGQQANSRAMPRDFVPISTWKVTTPPVSTFHQPRHTHMRVPDGHYLIA
jgi:hypothetical protein